MAEVTAVAAVLLAALTSVSTLASQAVASVGITQKLAGPCFPDTQHCIDLCMREMCMAPSDCRDEAALNASTPCRRSAHRLMILAC